MSASRGFGPDRSNGTRTGRGAGTRAWARAWPRLAGRLRRDTRGVAAVMAALSLVLLLTAAATALDLSRLYLAQVNAQRIADQSALAAALAYSQTSNNLTNAREAANSLTSTNSDGAASAVTNIVNAPSNDGNMAAEVQVTWPISLTPFGPSDPASSVTVGATAYAEIVSVNSAGCVIALDRTGITASGGQHLTASNCAVESANGITATSGAAFSAMTFYAAGTYTQSGGGSITTTPTSGQLLTGTATDPYASSNVFSRVNSLSSYLTVPTLSMGTAPSGGTAETCSGTLTLPYTTQYAAVTMNSGCSEITFTGGAGTTTNVAGYGLSLTSASANVVINIGSGTYNFDGMAFSSSNGATFTINITGSPTINVYENGLTLASTAILVVNGTATWNIGNGIANNSSGAMTFNNTDSTSPSTFNIIGGSAGGVSAEHGNITFPNGTYTITGGLYTNTKTLTFGNGSFNIAGGIIFNAGGGAMTFGSALSDTSVFEVSSPNSSGYAIMTSTSSTLTIGSFTNIDLDGEVAFYGSAVLGSGIYSVAGPFWADSSGGTITGSNVQIMATGAVTFGNGFSTIDLTAPTAITSSTVGDVGTVVLASNSSSPSTITQGASNTILVGAIYLPSSDLTMAGSGNLTGDGACLVVDVASITFQGAGEISTDCPGLSGGVGGGTAKLAQ